MPTYGLDNIRPDLNKEFDKQTDGIENDWAKILTKKLNELNIDTSGIEKEIRQVTRIINRNLKDVAIVDRQSCD